MAVGGGWPLCYYYDARARSFRLAIYFPRLCSGDNELEIYTLLLFLFMYTFFSASAQGDKSTETSVCKCCDIKTDNGKRLLLPTAQKYDVFKRTSLKNMRAVFYTHTSHVYI